MKRGTTTYVTTLPNAAANLARKLTRGTEPVWVMLENVPGRSGEVRARVVDFNESSLGVELPFWLREGDLVGVKGPASLGLNGHGKARVAHCEAVADGYRAGLVFEEKQPVAEKPAGLDSRLLRHPASKSQSGSRT